MADPSPHPRYRAALADVDDENLLSQAEALEATGLRG
jgi:hypothetical protein